MAGKKGKGREKWRDQRRKGEAGTDRRFLFPYRQIAILHPSPSAPPPSPPPPPRADSGVARLTALWTPFALLITSRHARRFVPASRSFFHAKLPTDHNYSANNNRPTVSCPIHACYACMYAQCKYRVDATIYGSTSRGQGVNKCSVRCRSLGRSS